MEWYVVETLTNFALSAKSMDLLYIWGDSEDGANKDCLLFAKISDRLNTIIWTHIEKFKWVILSDNLSLIQTVYIIVPNII